MPTIREVAEAAASSPRPVLIVDTCNFLDLFRYDANSDVKLRARGAEVRAAVDLLRWVRSDPPTVTLILPELVPREYSDRSIEFRRELDKWLGRFDQVREDLRAIRQFVGLALPESSPVQSGLADALGSLADGLIGAAPVLDRDRDCLDRAVARVIDKRRPSQANKQEMKDCMNVEQAIELGRQLRETGYSEHVVFVSSNKADFAESTTSAMIHPDLEPDFRDAGLGYAVSLEAAIGPLLTRFPP